MPAFRFQVRWDNQTFTFQDVSGLDALGRARRVALRNGVFRGTTAFRDWFNQLKSSNRRLPVTVSLLDDLNRPTRVWTVSSAFPAKITGPDLQAAGNDVAIETLEITCDGVSLS